MSAGATLLWSCSMFVLLWLKKKRPGRKMSLKSKTIKKSHRQTK